MKRASPESITAIGSMDSGPAPQVGSCRPTAHPGMTIAGNNMLTTANPFDSKTILDGIRRWVEIETPTATLDGLGVDGQGAHTHYEQMYISSIEPRVRLLHRLYQTLR